jgi:hypothetical protein
MGKELSKSVRQMEFGIQEQMQKITQKNIGRSHMSFFELFHKSMPFTFSLCVTDSALPFCKLLFDSANCLQKD